MFKIPFIKASAYRGCAVPSCWRCGECVQLESTWRRGHRVYTVQLWYCWKHFRELVKHLPVVNQYSALVDAEIDKQEGIYAPPPPSPTTLADVADQLISAAGGAEHYESRKIPIIKAFRVVTGLGLKEAKDAIEAAYARLQMPAPLNGQPAVK